MMESRSRTIVRRLSSISVMLLVAGGFVAVQLGVGTSSANSAMQLASDTERANDMSASRGADRVIVHGTLVELTTTTEPPTTTSTTVASTATLPPTTVTALATTTTTKPKPVATTTKPPPPPTTVPAPASTGPNSQTGVASYYTHKAGGCAHRTLSFGTTVTVTNVSNGKTATCVVNDRGPFIAGRIVDLDITVFRQLASPSAGVFQARISW